MRRVVKIISNIVFFTGLTIAGIFLVFYLTGRQPVKLFVVSSGSMEPAIKTGSVIIVAPQPTYQVGDIITFLTAPGSKATTTHRIVAAGENFFKVAGDANSDLDPNPVVPENVVGVVKLSVPYIGYLSAFAKTPKGFILLVIIPATIVIYEELKNFAQEIKKLLSKFNVPSLPKSEKINPALVAIPVFFAILITISISVSFFMDREVSMGNMFVRGTPTPTPISSPQPSPSPDISPSPQPSDLPSPTPLTTPSPSPSPIL